MDHVFHTVALTGHRPDMFKPDQREWILGQLDRAVVKLRDEHGMSIGISGMAAGTDQWWAKALLKHKVDLYAYVPFNGQETRWKKHYQEEYKDILSKAAGVRIVHDEPTPQAFHIRNQQMLKDCNLMLGVKISTLHIGGTASTLEKAELIERPVILFEPDTHKVKKIRW